MGMGGGVGGGWPSEGADVIEYVFLKIMFDPLWNNGFTLVRKTKDFTVCFWSGT